MPVVTEANRTIARATVAAFGGVARILRHTDANEEAIIDVLRSPDRPWEGVTSYATIGLSDQPLPGDVSPPLGVEIVGAVDSGIDVFSDVLATAAFYVINAGWRCKPGAVFSEAVRTHVPDTTVPHLMFVTPFLWEDELRSRRVGNKNRRVAASRTDLRLRAKLCPPTRSRRLGGPVRAGPNRHIRPLARARCLIRGRLGAHGSARALGAPESTASSRAGGPGTQHLLIDPW